MLTFSPPPWRQDELRVSTYKQWMRNKQNLFQRCFHFHVLRAWCASAFKNTVDRPPFVLQMKTEILCFPGEPFERERRQLYIDPATGGCLMKISWSCPRDGETDKQRGFCRAACQRAVEREEQSPALPCHKWISHILYSSLHYSVGIYSGSAGTYIAIW